MTIPFFRPGSVQKQDGNASFSLRLAVSYILFLLLCLALGVILYTSSTQNARESFWEHRAVELEQDIMDWDDDLAAMDSYTRQLLIDNTFVRFAGMEGVHQKGYIYTAYEVMQTLTSRIYSISDLPVIEDRIYMKNSGYVISASQFTEARQFYEDYRIYHPGGFEPWLEMVLSSVGEGGCMDISSYTGRENDAIYIRDIDAIMNKRIPAVIWFELDMAKLRKRFLPQQAYEQAVLLVRDQKGARQLLLTQNSEGEALAQRMSDISFEKSTHGVLDDMHLIHRTSAYNDWQYTIALPKNLCDAALGNYDIIFWLMMMVALLMGCAMIFMLVRRQLRPLHQLDRQLKKAEGDRDQLQQEMDSQRPMLRTSYLRKLLSGHVASKEEFAYMMDFLGLSGDYRFYVLYCVAHRQDYTAMDANAEYDLIAEHLEKYLSVACPMCYYTTLDRSFIALVTYDRDTQDPLMDLQKRVVQLHEDLSDEHGLWFYAGVGTQCTQPQNLWESYEQARTAARYTAKHHIFLPYEMMRKDTASVYYPVEISAKLQHFITTGNREQVVEMFALIHRENMLERTLPITQLNFLLSDLKNTLLKARFLIEPSNAEDEERLARIEQRLNEQPNFPTLEDCAQQLCRFFTRSAEPSDPIPDVERYLQENYADPSMCLSKLSDRFNMSESYLSHLFKGKTGQNFSVYLETLRLNEAARRLANPECNLTNLFADLGYNNPTTFRRAFKKRYGITPSEMRAQK